MSAPWRAAPRGPAAMARSHVWKNILRPAQRPLHSRRCLSHTHRALPFSASGGYHASPLVLFFRGQRCGAEEWIVSQHEPSAFSRRPFHRSRPPGPQGLPRSPRPVQPLNHARLFPLHLPDTISPAAGTSPESMIASAPRACASWMETRTTRSASCPWPRP
jgi:hypothetical protein